METTYWHQQSIDKPLFSDVLWGRPEQRRLAGKLVIIGGSAQAFSAVSKAYAAAEKAKIGVIRTILPDSLKRTVSKIRPDSEFAPSNKIGSFSAQALDTWLAAAEWSDGVLFPGDLGQNSETFILLERFLESSKSILSLTGDSLNALLTIPLSSWHNLSLSIAPSFTQFQKLLINLHYPTAAKTTMSLVQIVNLLHSFSSSYPLKIILEFNGCAVVAVNGKVSTSPIAENIDLIDLTAICSVWQLQQPNKAFEAMTSGIFDQIKD